MTRRLRLLVALGMLLAACAAPSPTPTPPSSASAPNTESAAPSASGTVSPSPQPAAWTRREPGSTQPAAREDHTWTVTPDGATAYLFGGRGSSGAAVNDLWAFDLATDRWQPVSAPGGPPARFGHNAAWVDGIGLVIFAGQAGATFFNDLWAYDPAADAWSQLPASGAVPVARYGSCAAIGPDGRLWISHGFTSEGNRYADTLAYDFTTASWTDETPAGDLPVARCLHACWWTDAGAFALYAGQTDGVTALADLWWLTPGPRPGTNAWALQPAAGLPADRNRYAAARWGAGTLVFGGQGGGDGADALRSDTWWLPDAGGAQPVLGPDAGPSGRWGAELIADPARGRLLLFGGTDGSAAFDDLWELRVPLPLP